MRKGKDRTYRLPILVLAANNVLHAYKIINKRCKREKPMDGLWYTPHISHGEYHNPAVQREYNFTLKIPRSSFYRIVNNLVVEGYMLKVFYGKSKIPRFNISLKGLLSLTETNR